MKVVILCGGMGTRLREYTESTPKPMVRVGGIPIVVHIMQMYAAAGMTEFVLCLGYMGHAIREYFLNYEANNRDFTVELGRPGSVEYHGVTADGPSWKVTLVETGAATMTGARLARASKYLTPGDTFAVTYGDGVARRAACRRACVPRFTRTQQGTVTGGTGRRAASVRFKTTKVGRRRSFNEKPARSAPGLNQWRVLLLRALLFLEYLSPHDPSCILEREPLERCFSRPVSSLGLRAPRLLAMQWTPYRDWEAISREVLEEWRSSVYFSIPAALPGTASWRS